MKKLWKISVAGMAGGTISTMLNVFPSPIFVLFFFASIIIGTVAAIALYRRLERGTAGLGVAPCIATGFLTGVIACLLTNGILYTFEGQPFTTNMFYTFFYPIRPYGDVSSNDFALKATFYFELMTFVQTGVFTGIVAWGMFRRGETGGKRES